MAPDAIRKKVISCANAGGPEVKNAVPKTAARSVFLDFIVLSFHILNTNFSEIKTRTAMFLIAENNRIFPNFRQHFTQKSIKIRRYFLFAN